jgi:hypothetical protein
MKIKLCILIIIVFSVTFSCKEKYDPPVVKANHNYLVVDGFLNSGGDSSLILLSRTRNLGDTVTSIPETNAVMQLETDGGAVSFATNLGGGQYLFPGMSLPNNISYRLRISTADGKEYLSDDMTVKTTPPIDSVNYTYNDKGVTIYANTHDPSNNTRYYRYEYDETWEYHSNIFSEIKYTGAGNPPFVYRTGDDWIYVCYRSQKSHKIYLASSAGLESDVIYQFPIQFIARNTEPISVRYSINVKQYALTKEAANYWSNLKKTTEELGSIFDAQPSQLKGNIRCLSDTTLPVLGFMSISSVEKKRIFILRGEAGPWTYGEACMVHNIPPDSFHVYFDLWQYEAVSTHGLANLDGAQASCVDCTLKGGTLTKPDFW